MRCPSEAARKTVQVGFELGLHRPHDGDTCTYYAEVGFQGRPNGFIGADVGNLTRFGLVNGYDAEGGDDAGTRKGGSVSCIFGREYREGYMIGRELASSCGAYRIPTPNSRVSSIFFESFIFVKESCQQWS